MQICYVTKQMEKYVLYDRSGKNKREAYIHNDGTVVILMHNTLYFTITGSPECIEAIDPDGGPFIHKGMKFGNWEIDTIDFFVEVESAELVIVHCKATQKE